MDTFLDIVFWIDIVLNFRTGFIDHGQHVTDPHHIAEHYLGSWFIVDLIGSLPFEKFIPDANSASRKSVKIAKWAKIPKLLRAGRLLKYLKRYAKYYMLFLVLASLLLLTHFIGCAWLTIVEPCKECVINATHTSECQESIIELYNATGATITYGENLISGCSSDMMLRYWLCLSMLPLS